MARDSSSGQTLSENYSVLADYCFTVGSEGERECQSLNVVNACMVLLCIRLAPFGL